MFCLDPSNITSHDFEEGCHTVTDIMEHTFSEDSNQDHLVTQVASDPSEQQPLKLLTGMSHPSKNLVEFKLEQESCAKYYKESFYCAAVTDFPSLG